MQDKKQIREHYLSLRQDLDIQYIKENSKLIAEKLSNTPEYKKAKNIFIYLSYDKEIDTSYIIDIAKNDNKKIFAPALCNEKRRMVFKPITDEFYENRLGIKEAKTDIEKKSDEDTLIIVPAIVYTKEGYRVGYGGGYYDYFLDNNKYLATIGICHQDFIIERFNIEKFDKNVDIVITEQKVYK